MMWLCNTAKTITCFFPTIHFSQASEVGCNLPDERGFASLTRCKKKLNSKIVGDGDDILYMS
jgi:hypothetical protein